ncbi:MAG TPA: phage holin family protein [Pirellulales bacterium]
MYGPASDSPTTSIPNNPNLMAQDKDSLFGPTMADLGRLREELRALVAIRWELARLELVTAFADVRRLVVALVIAGLLALISLPVLVVATANALGGVLGLSVTGWLFISFATLVVAAGAVAWLGWRRFQRHFVGLEETLEVLQEDQAWVESLTASVKPKSR